MKMRFDMLTALFLTASFLAVPASVGAATISFDQIGAVSGSVRQSPAGSYQTVSPIRFDQISYGGASAFCDATGDLNSDAAACWLTFNTATNTFFMRADEGLYTPTGALLPGLDGSPVMVLTGTGLNLVGSLGPVLVIQGGDEKLDELLSYFGLSGGTWTFVNTIIRNPGGFPVNQTVNVTSADLDNSSEDITIQQIPEPGLLALFGLGLVGTWHRRSRAQK